MRISTEIIYFQDIYALEWSMPFLTSPFLYKNNDRFFKIYT